MRLGLNLGYWGLGNDGDNLAVAQEADRLGYSVVWAAEAYGSDTATVLTWIAAQTRNVDVGSAVFQIPARTPAASAAAVTGPSSGSPTGSGDRAAGRNARDGVLRNAAFSSNPGMERQAITGTYVLHEHTFPCQTIRRIPSPASAPAASPISAPRCSSSHSW